MPKTRENVTWLTQEAFDRLQHELNFLTGEGRAEIVSRIEAAREEGDLKENGGYHAAKDEQGKREARIRQLQQLLESAQVGQAPPDDGIVEPGMLVTARLADEEVRFLLGSREAAEEDLEVFSEKSPLGAAINGKRAGDTATYITPKGKELTVEIIDAKPYGG